MTDRIKPSINFMILCDDVRQEAGGKISLMGLFENIYATTFPAVHPRLAIITEWSGGKGEFGLMTRIFTPDRREIVRETSSRIKLAGANVRHRDVSIHLNIEFRAPGAYWVDSYLDDELMTSMPLNVVLLKGQKVH